MHESHDPDHDRLVQSQLVDAFTRERFAEMFVSQSRRAQLGLMVAAALIAFIWYDRTQSVAALGWFITLAGVTAWRYHFTDRLVRRASPERVSLRIAALLALNGCMLAVPLLAFDRLTVLERSAVSIILLGAATASIATTSGYRSVFLAFAAPMLVPLALAWAWVSPKDGASPVGQYGIALLILVFLVFMLSVARQAHRIVEESSRFRYGEQQLNRELSLALEAASDANRAKTQFLAAASHDLRQPIHSINVLIAALSLRALDAKSSEIVALLETVTGTLSQQLDSLLDISKLDAGIVTPLSTPLRLDEIVRSHHASLAPVASGRGLDATLGRLDQVSVMSDAALLTRVLSNLTDNALKYSPRSGSIRMSVQRDGDDAVLTVADTGIGIPLHEQEHVFREFYQVGNVERDRSRGLGLGLSIVQRLCRLLEVDLRLRSASGQGTTIILRMRAVHPVAAPTTTQGRKPTSPRGLKVMVVDDELMSRDSMGLLLRELGCEVHLAADTEAAVSIARSHTLDVVLSDYRLRDGDSGLQTLHALHGIQPAIRAALVTGDTAPDRLRDAQAVGVPLLHKPVTLPQLMTVLVPLE